MTDKLIERINADRAQSLGKPSLYGPDYYAKLETRILADAKIIKAAEEYIGKLEANEHRPHPRAHHVIDLDRLQAAYRAAVSERDT